jgi:hypothetical protein
MKPLVAFIEFEVESEIGETGIYKKPDTED